MLFTAITKSEIIKIIANLIKRLSPNREEQPNENSVTIQQDNTVPSSTSEFDLQFKLDSAIKESMCSSPTIKKSQGLELIINKHNP